MKKFFGKKFLGIPMAVIAVVLVAAVALAAAFTLVIPSHVEILPLPPPPDYTIGVYSDEECTIPVENIEWGSLVAGTAAPDKIVYIQNEGNRPVAVTVSCSIPTLVTFGASPSPLNLAVSTSGACTLSLTAGPNPANVDFSTTFDSDPQP